MQYVLTYDARKYRRVSPRAWDAPSLALHIQYRVDPLLDETLVPLHVLPGDLPLGEQEEPQVLHYGVPGQGEVLVPGMTFTIEPMVNAGKRHVKLLKDGWTVVTKDRSLSAQWEHTLLVSEDGYEALTRLDGEPL